MNFILLFRYLINDTFFKDDRDSPIFFYTGNEGDIEVFAQNTGFMWEIAAEFHALVGNVFILSKIEKIHYFFKIHSIDYFVNQRAESNLKRLIFDRINN